MSKAAVRPRVQWINRTANAQGNYLGYATAGNRLGEALENEVEFDDDAPLALTFTAPAVFRRVEGKVNVLFTMVETSVLHSKPDVHDQMQAGLDQADMVIAPSRWCADVFRKHTQTPVYVAPLGVDTKAFSPGGRRAWTPEMGRPFRWLYSGAPNARKWGGHTFTELYQALFVDLPVEVYFKTTGAEWIAEMAAEHWIETLEPDLYRRGNLTVDGRLLPLEQLVALYRSADAGLCLHCGEGWGLVPLEMMACGVPILVTDYSGTRDFCTAANSYPVKASEREEFGFVIPERQDAADKAVAVMLDPQAAYRVGRQAARDAKRFTWGASARKIRGILAHIAEGRQVAA